jgi:hypothetical protein
MIERRNDQVTRTPAKPEPESRGIATASSPSRWAPVVRLLPPLKSSREWDRVRRIAYL